MVRYMSKFPEYYEVSAFGTKEKIDTMMDFYINNVNLFKLFVYFFKEKSEPLIKKCSKDPIQLKYFDEGYTDQPIKVADTSELQSLFEAEKLIQHYNLSPREIECMRLLSEGKSFKEIGKILNLSPNTIQFYTNNLKKKVGARKVAELIKIYFLSQI